MRVIWKDSYKPKEYEPIKYRNVYIFGTPDGWEVNAIDAYYNEEGLHGTEKRKRYGIQIIGKKKTG